MTLLRRVLSYIVALARELSDESAYARHLQLTGHPHSASEWRTFIDHQHKRKYQNGKCC
jgi:hypothetical protein